MADSAHPIHLNPANEQVSAEAVEIALAEIVQNARYALAWFEENDLDHLARPLQKALAQTIGYSIRLSDNIGEAGFDLDESNRTIFLSSFALNAVIASSSAISGTKREDPLEIPLVSAAIAIYLFHELTHISQKFIRHEQAGEIRGAFGDDIFAMIDCITDIKAAHCATISAIAFDGSFSKTEYVSIFSNNVVLAHHILVNAFSIKNAPHKKKRALGLLSTSAICDVALKCQDGKKNALMALAMTPVYSSIIPEKQKILCICPESGDIIFVSDENTNGLSATELWESLENIPTGDAIAFLRLAFTSSFYSSF